MGSTSLETAKTVIKELDLPMTNEEFLEESDKEFQKLFPDTQVLPGMPFPWKWISVEKPQYFQVL